MHARPELVVDGVQREELLARVRSVLRRVPPRVSAEAAISNDFAFDGMRLDASARQLRDREGQDVALTSGEFELLLAFLRRPNQVLTRDDLMSCLHGRDAGPYDRSIDVQVGRLRRKIDDDYTEKLIQTVRGAGYRFGD